MLLPATRCQRWKSYRAGKPVAMRWKMGTSGASRTWGCRPDRQTVWGRYRAFNFASYVKFPFMLQHAQHKRGGTWKYWALTVRPFGKQGRLGACRRVIRYFPNNEENYDSNGLF